MMTPEIGHFALVLAFSIAICQSVFPLYGYFTNQDGFVATAKPMAILQGLALLVSFLVLMNACSRVSKVQNSKARFRTR